MKILISGGIKTQNIVDGIEKKFESSGIDFVIVPYIEDIDDIYAKGEYFDKALIIEQCWNHDFEITDEFEIRQKLDKFARDSANRAISNVSYIFLTQTEESASILYEEILPITTDSTIVVKAPKYSVGFFKGLITCDKSQFPPEIVYEPQIETPEFTAQIQDREDDPKDCSYTAKDVADISEDLFGKPSENVAESLEYNPGVSFDRDIDNEKTENAVTELDEIESDTPIESSIDTEKQEESSIDNTEFEDIGIDDGDFSELTRTDSTQIENDFDKLDINDSDNAQDTPDSQNLQAENTEYTDILDSIPCNTDTIENVHTTNKEINTETRETYIPEFNDNDYEHIESEREPKIPINTGYNEAPIQTQKPVFKLGQDQIRSTLDIFASRGNSIIVTGCGGCGTSTIAYNLANTIANIGYTVLLVDMDTEGRSQAYISKENYNCVEPEGANLMAAINSTSGINAHISIVRQGFHLLTMGLAGDSSKLEDIIQVQKMARFANLAKTSHNFVIYDMPFKDTVGCASDITFTADNIVLTVDSSNWGITKAMLALCNIDSEDMQDMVFSRCQILYNRYRGFSRIMGKKVKSAMDIAKVMDSKVRELLDTDPGYYFQALHICGIINDDLEFENSWFGTVPYSNTPKGQKIFMDLLKNIVLKQ